MSMVPALASTWSNPDERTWDFKLRDSVKFHTGDALESRDVVFSLLRARDDPRSVLRSSLSGVESVEALPGRRVRVRTQRPDAHLAARLREVWIVSRRFVEEKGDFATASCGTGPYRLTDWRQGASVEMERFDGHWRGPAAIPRALFVARDFGAPDASSFVPFHARLVLAGFPGTPAFLRAQQEGAVPHFAANLSIAYLGFDLRSASPTDLTLPRGGKGNPFLDPRVREAVARAVRLRALVASRSGEGYFPTQLVSPVVFGYAPGIPPTTADAAEAARLLAASPYRDGFDVVLDVRRSMERYGEIASDLAAIGIRVKTRVSTEEGFFARLRDGKTPLYVLRFSCRTGDAQELFDKWLHSRDERLGLGVSNHSYDRSPIPGLDEEIEAARAELDPARRRELLQGIMRRAMDAHVAVPLFSEKDYTFASRDVVFTNRADSFRLISEMRFK
jgi:peptide/nickel transport system substrate-binding protein